MDPTVDVPEITTACWGILKKSPDSVMCASARMMVKRKGAAAAGRRRLHARCPTIRSSSWARPWRTVSARCRSIIRTARSSVSWAVPPAASRRRTSTSSFRLSMRAAPWLARLPRFRDSDLGLHIAVCDGGSTDDTVVIAQQAGATVVTASTAGRGRQLAAGADAGSAPWILFLHADTVLGPGWNAVVAQLHVSQDQCRQGRLLPPAVRYLRLPSARRVERLAAWRCRLLGLPYGDQGLLISRALLRIPRWLQAPAVDGGCRAGTPRRCEEPGPARRRGRSRRRRATSATAGSDDRLRNLCCLSLYFAGRVATSPSTVLQPMRRHLVIFARAPQAGRVKRRLGAEIGVLEAARFYQVAVGWADRATGAGSSLDGLAVHHA